MSKQRAYTSQTQGREARALHALRVTAPAPHPGDEPPLYNLLLACLPVLRDLEDAGIQALTAHLSPAGVSMTCAPPPPDLKHGMDWCYLQPPAGMPRAPVTCRSIVGQAMGRPVAIEWREPPRGLAGRTVGGAA